MVLFMERITQAELKSLLTYNEETGYFYWKNLVGYRSKVAGKKAGTLNARGYIAINISSRPMLAHRLAWLYMHGEWPSLQIDHINGVRTDNRIANLRLATRYENMRNIKRKSTNKSGYKGVSWSAECKKWRACIVHQGKTVHLGVFTEKDAAYEAYCNAASQFYGPFARLD